MTFPLKIKKLYAYHLMLSCIVSVFFVLQPVRAQQKSDITMAFTKMSDSIASGNICFNILKIVNSSAKPISAQLTFSNPENWRIISLGTGAIHINNGDTAFVPIHISPSSNATGGVSYIISALLKTDTRVLAASTNVTISATNKWDFTVLKNNLYVTETNPNTTIQVKLSNRGNTNELIKLNYKIGKLLSFRNDDLEYTDFVNLPAYKDTTILQTISYKKKVSTVDQLRYQNNWRESSLMLTASTQNELKSTALQIKKLNSYFENTRNQSSPPLNIDLQTYNILSSQSIRNNARAYGSVLFKKEREIQYNIGVQSFGFGSEDNFDLSRQLTYSLRYHSRHNDIQLGYNVSNVSLHTINGRGLTGTLKLPGTTSINYSLIQNPFSNIFGQSVGFNTSIKGISFSAELINENELNNQYKATSVEAGLGLNLFKHHSIAAQVLASKAGFQLNADADTSVIGLSYRILYNVRYKNFYLRANHTNAANNYIQNSGLQQTNIDSRLRFSDKLYLTLYANRQLYSATRYPYNFYNDVSNNITDNARLTLAYYLGNIIFQAGPNYNGSSRNMFTNTGKYRSEYTTYQPGVWTSATIKITSFRSITPNFTLNKVLLKFKTTDPGLSDYNVNGSMTYSVGLNYYDPNWRIYAYYTSGSVSDLYRSVQVDTKPTLSSSIQFRPYYETFLMNKKLKLSAYVNYAYYMPSGRENIIYSARYDHYLKNGWNLNANLFMFTNIRVVDDGRVSTKDMNLMIGVSKAFNIQQPRLKYHNMKIQFFNDLDGNKIKTDNEPPVSDIIVSVEKDNLKSDEPSAIPEIKLISDQKGMAVIDNLPQDNYRLSFTPVNNLQYLYFLDGTEQFYQNKKTNTVFVPLAESYKIKGKILVYRDPNSTEGKLDLSGVRVTAKGSNGENYSVLTDNFGAFVISVPSGDKYMVKVNNVFGEYFRIDNDEIQVQFTSNKTVNVDFIYVEQKREIQFDNGNQFYNFNSISN